VTPLLRAAGHDVFTLTLSGVGDRAHLAGPSITLDTHIRDVVGLLEAEELCDVVLLGHSYGGMVITGVADRAVERLRHLVYLDAFIPEDGQALIDIAAPARRAAMVAHGEAHGYLESLPLDLLGVPDPDDRAWVARRVTTQPYGTFSEKLRLRGVDTTHLGRTYVYCSNPPTGSFTGYLERVRNDPKWRAHELKTGHDCMVTEPAATARIILEAAGG